MEHNSDFRYDLKVGQEGENALAEILQGSKIEVKKDIKTKETGNVFVEYESRGKPSGIANSQSEFYCFIVEHLMIIVPLQELKKLARKYYKTKRDVVGGDNNTSKGILISLKELVDIMEKVWQ